MMLQREGWKSNKLVYRIYCEEGLNLRLKGRRKRPARGRIKLPSNLDFSKLHIAIELSEDSKLFGFP